MREGEGSLFFSGDGERECMCVKIIKFWLLRLEKDSEMSPVTCSESAMAVEMTSPVILASEEPEKKGAKRARKEKAATDPCTTAEATKKKAPKKPAEAAAPSCEAGASNCDMAVDAVNCTEEEKKDSSNSLIVAKAVRSILKGHTTPMNMSADALPALNSKVSEIIYDAIGRAVANGRKTLKNSDF